MSTKKKDKNNYLNIKNLNLDRTYYKKVLDSQRHIDFSLDSEFEAETNANKGAHCQSVDLLKPTTQ